MYYVKVNDVMNQITSVYYYLGLWHRGKDHTVRETTLKSFYLMYFLLFPISLLWGALCTDNIAESIFLVEVAIIISVLLLRLFYMITKQKKFLSLLNHICVYSIADNENFNLVNDKLQQFMKYVKFFLVATYPTCIAVMFITPFVATKRTLFCNIGFPLDWKNNEIAFWIAYSFMLSQVALTMIGLLGPIIIWYAMINCALRYKVLGNQMRNIGAIRPLVGAFERKIAAKHNIYIGDLIDAVRSYNHLRDLINQLESFMDVIFLAQLATSSLCICCSICCLVFNLGGNFMERMVYLETLVHNVFEIFMVMYLGNEINLSSGRLASCLFESNWMEQRQSTKKCVTIFAELVKRPQVLVTGKLYPLILETFRRILNAAYSMFNILRNVK